MKRQRAEKMVVFIIYLSGILRRKQPNIARILNEVDV